MNYEYKDVRDIIVDFCCIFDIIPTGETFNRKLWSDDNGNPRNYSFDTNGTPTSDLEKAIEKQKEFECHYYRKAETLEDFRIVFETEFLKQKLIDKDIFRKRQIEIFTAKRKAVDGFEIAIPEDTCIVGLPIEYISKPGKIDLEYYIDLLDRYIKFLTEDEVIDSNHIQIESEKGFDSQKSLIEIANSENKFWVGIPMDKVIKHFEVLTSKKNKNGNPFLTNEQFVSFLKKGFLNDNTQTLQKINCSVMEKGFVIKRFYEFYALAVSQYSFPAKKRKFVSLFCNCFDNWEQNTIESFFRPNKTKENW